MPNLTQPKRSYRDTAGIIAAGTAAGTGRHDISFTRKSANGENRPISSLFFC